MVIHGANDPRVPVGESQHIARVLTEKGIRCDLVVYDDDRVRREAEQADDLRMARRAEQDDRVALLDELHERARRRRDTARHL